MLKTRVLPFEYEVLKRLNGLKIDWSNQRLLIALSGGRDSIALLNVLVSLKSRLKFELEVAHVNHGRAIDREVALYRKKASAFAKSQAKKLGLKFHALKHSGNEIKSEAELRKVREALLETCRKDFKCDWIVFAHHADDLLETRLIRLIRGTGAQGLKAMSLAHGQKLRPLLHVSLYDLCAYSEQKKLKWVTDPTNQENFYFRNWIRNIWLPMLEEKRSGSRQALSRSLEQISESLPIQKHGLDVIKRKEFALLSLIEKREVLARVMLERGARDFSRRQIDEILKRLSSHQGVSRRKMSFEVGGLEWRVNAEQIEAVRL